MNIKLLLPMLFITLNAGASTFDDIEKRGLPLPDGGIKIVPLKKMPLLGVNSKTLMEAQRQIKENGYYEVDNPQARVLMKMRYLEPLKAGSNNSADTNLKSTINDVGLAFHFDGIPVDSSSVVGFAAAGAYKNGWSGVTEIFTDNELGTCQYTLNNIKLSHGSELIPQEICRKDVNGKVTVIDVRGNANSGYVYSVHWADNNAMHDLKCANLLFAKSNTAKLISLARKIDIKAV